MHRYDIHAHIITTRLVTNAVFKGRWAFSKSMMNSLAKKSNKGVWWIALVLWIRNVFNKKNLNPNPLIKEYLKSEDKYLFNFMNELEKSEIDFATALMLDMDYAFGANTSLDFDGQVDFYQGLKDDVLFKPIIPFLGLDLRREDKEIEDIITKAIYNKMGLKFYPPLGWNPKDYISRPWWKVLATHETPCLVHCSPGGMGQFSEFAHPSNWFDILWNNPMFKLCFAHSGGNFNDWTEILKTWFNDFPYVFVDTAFHDAAYFDTEVYFRKLRKLINQFPDKVIFGSDYPLHLVYYSYYILIKLFKDNLKNEQYNEWDCISSYNPETFLSGILNGI